MVAIESERLDVFDAIHCLSPTMQPNDVSRTHSLNAALLCTSIFGDIEKCRREIDRNVLGNVPNKNGKRKVGLIYGNSDKS